MSGNFAIKVGGGATPNGKCHLKFPFWFFDSFPYAKSLTNVIIAVHCHHVKGFRISSVNLTCQWQLFEVVEFLSWRHSPCTCFHFYLILDQIGPIQPNFFSNPSPFPLRPNLPDFCATHLFSSTPHESKKTPHYPGHNFDENLKF